MELLRWQIAILKLNSKIQFTRNKKVPSYNLQDTKKSQIPIHKKQTTHKMQIKQLLKANIKDIIELEKNNAPDKPYYARYDDKALNFIFDNPKTCHAIGLYDDDKLIGWGAYRTNWYRHSKEKGVEISSIVINKNYRRKGLGTVILNKIISKLKENKIKNIFLTVSPLNVGALILYSKNGFIIFDYKKDVYGLGSDRVYLRLSFI